LAAADASSADVFAAAGVADANHTKQAAEVDLARDAGWGASVFGTQHLGPRDAGSVTQCQQTHSNMLSAEAASQMQYRK